LPLTIRPGQEAIKSHLDEGAGGAISVLKPKAEKKDRYRDQEYLVMPGVRNKGSGENAAHNHKLILLVDPQNSKAIVWVKEPVFLSPDERKRLEEKETYEGKEYLVWDTRREPFTAAAGDRRETIKVPEGTAPEGRFLVDPDNGRVAYLKDPTIGGVIEEHNGVKTTRFPAPKTKIMQIIIDGVLTLKLNWSLVLIGAMIAVTLELCGVSSLAFAVGLYVPIQYSVPVFLGGIVRWAVDRYQASRTAAELAAAGDDAEARARAEIDAIRKSETSPGVLLASGYIAGGSLAGVVAAFLEFAPGFKSSLNFEHVVADQGEGVSSLIAIGVFATLVLFALMVGMGQLFRPPEETNSEAP
jgi:OPT oligopeptide transporter protein